VSTDLVYEYVVVGSGAGGGTVAARLAELGHRVLLLEAGNNPLSAQSSSTFLDKFSRLPADYEVPVFHPFASENDAFKWDFFVRHYGKEIRQKRDPKYTEHLNGNQVRGVLYPRASTLGGCTAHHAQIMVYPHNEDWEYIARITNDSSWSAANMRSYFERIERCSYRKGKRLLSCLGWNPTRHGFHGWLQTEIAMPIEALAEDSDLLKTISETLEQAFWNNEKLSQRLKWGVVGRGDPNDWRLVTEDAVGIRYIPISTRNHARHAVRERVIDVATSKPDRLVIEMDALATKVLFDGDNKAIGVEYLKGARLYNAHQSFSYAEPSAVKQVLVSREVILAGGTFNTPQLLKLSGIGPRLELERFGIPVRVDLPGVGNNLQDRYEISVVCRMRDEWEAMKGATFTTNDRQYRQWHEERKGVYTTNGAMMAVIKRSLPERQLPDLFLFALLGRFSGYYPGYSNDLSKHHNYLTWAIIKAHTNNTAGTVTLRSADPRDAPEINFRYFDEGTYDNDEDLQSVIEGIKFARKLTQPLIESGIIVQEELPGQNLQSDEELAKFVKDNAWGHHASCSCPIGNRLNGGVVNGDFSVHGTKGLRIVDASVFPRIPGFFIVTSVYMIAEKAADVISRDAINSKTNG
jgi:choline dehydrogenase-like flavoprotein